MMSLRALAGALTIGIAAAPFIGAAPVLAAEGERASGTITVKTAISGTPLALTANVVLYRRGPLYRLDLLSLTFPGADSTTTALIGALLGPHGATILYDGARGVLTAYSNGNRTFYRQARDAAPAPAGASPPAPGPRTGGDPLALLAAVANATRDLASASITLSGTGTVDGHPTTELDVDLRRRVPVANPDRFHAHLALADDLDGFPVRIDADDHGWSGFTGSFRLDLSAVQPASPTDDVFAVPAGYTRVTNLGDVLRPT